MKPEISYELKIIGAKMLLARIGLVVSGVRVGRAGQGRAGVSLLLVTTISP